MIIAEILTPWAIDPEDGANIPKLILDYWDTIKTEMPNGSSINDSTYQNMSGGIPDPNMLVVYVKMGPIAFSVIQADINYQVLWYETA